VSIVMDVTMPVGNGVPTFHTLDAGAAIAALSAALRLRIGDERYELWFDRKADLVLHENTLRIGVSNLFAANWIRTKLLDDVRAAARQVMAADLTVRVEVDAGVSARGERGNERRANAECGMRNAEVGGERQRAAGAVTPPVPTLNIRHTLEEFVVGPSNQLAYQAALQVATSPGQQFNPLFIHGRCGLGKTHLLQGICQKLTKLHPEKKWIYLTGEAFTNEFLEAIRTHKTDAFRRKIRQADVLIIDDVHFLANKKATQEEFLHTFNQIDAGGKQVVLASDCAPRQIAQMAESLVSRFVSGMVVRVDSPDLPTRLEIVRRKSVRQGWNLSDAVLMHVASMPAVSVRELEGTLLQVMAGINLMAGEGAEKTAAIMAQLKERNGPGRQPASVEKIVVAAAELFGVTTGNILGSGRDKAASLARAVACYVARQQTSMSFPEIGRALGNKNHSTVIAACQRVETLINNGELVCWNVRGEVRHMAMPEVVAEVEGMMRKA
jgi:chromosomal replication initiator protein